jgi:CBS domain containing-hemolysin-like protein
LEHLPFSLLALAGGPGAASTAAGEGAAHSGLPPGWALAIAGALVLVNGFFVAAEFALVKVRPTQIQPLAERGDRRARVARHMIQHLDNYLSATQLGITLTSLALGWLGEPAFAWLLTPVLEPLGLSEAAMRSTTLTAAFLTITILHIVLGELAPKSIAIREPQGTTLWTAVPLFIFYRLTFPAMWLLNKTANAVLRAIGIAPASEHDIGHSEEELRMLLAHSKIERQGQLKRELLDNVFELGDRIVRQIMVPRADVVFLDVERPLEEVLSAARQSGHTRFPLCEGVLDKVIGLVHIKDLFRSPTPPTDLRQVARPVTFVPETLTLDRLLKRLRGERVHLAAVIDEYGGVSGIVTLENVIEEIVGPIQDEFDTEKPELVQREDDVYLVTGSMLVADLEDELSIEFSDRNEDTIAGVALSELGRRPRVGDRVVVGPLTLEILDVELNRIKMLRATVDRALASPPSS